jgi:flavin-binding protein dodecin
VPAKTRKTVATGPAVVRLVESAGESDRSWDAAVVAAVKAAKVKEPVGVEVGRLWAELDGTRLRRYHAQVKVAYRQSQRQLGRRTH